MKQLNFLGTPEKTKDECCKADLQLDHYQMFTDGASKGNPGPAGIGIFCKKNGATFWQKGFYIGKTTNNVAEFSALYVGLQLLLADTQHLPAPAKLDIFADSQLLVFQLNGLYKSKSENIKPILNLAKQLLQNFSWSISYIPRENNGIADQLANHGIAKKILLPPNVQLGTVLPG